VVGIVFSSLFGFPENAYATCVNYIQSQTIAAAYEGDQTPTVHTMDTCGGDDTSYQIPIATTITFDGVQYSNVYATTNSVITFGNPDNTYWDYPNTPSISLYSMDWVSGWYNAPDTLNIMYSEGGFQLDLEVIPFGQWNAPTPSNINIIVAITNTGGISVAYSYQGPEYPNLRTGVRLHNGDIVSLEAWGATQIQAGDPTPTLAPEPIAEPTPTPTEQPLTPEEVQAEVVEAVTLANDIANLNNLIAAINGEEVNEPEPEPTTEPTEEPEPETTEDPDLPEPDVEVEPEVITPEDPRFPDDQEQTEPGDSNLPEDSDTTDEGNEEQDPTPEPSEEPVSQPEDTDPTPVPEQDSTDILEPVIPPSDNGNTGEGISEEELKKLNKLISANDAKLLAQLVGTNETIKQAVEEFTDRAEENTDAPMPYTIADATVEVQAEKLLEAVSVENLTEIFSNPTEAVGALVGNAVEVLSSPSEWGKDMTDDQREKAQEVIIPVILVSNIVSSVMSLRRL
jgi:hypothetical protein